MQFKGKKVAQAAWHRNRRLQAQIGQGKRVACTLGQALRRFQTGWSGIDQTQHVAKAVLAALRQSEICHARTVANDGTDMLTAIGSNKRNELHAVSLAFVSMPAIRPVHMAMGIAMARASPRLCGCRFHGVVALAHHFQQRHAYAFFLGR